MPVAESPTAESSKLLPTVERAPVSTSLSAGGNSVAADDLLAPAVSVSLAVGVAKNEYLGGGKSPPNVVVLVVSLVADSVLSSAARVFAASR